MDSLVDSTLSLWLRVKMEPHLGPNGTSLGTTLPPYLKLLNFTNHSGPDHYSQWNMTHLLNIKINPNISSQTLNSTPGDIACYAENLGNDAVLVSSKVYMFCSLIFVIIGLIGNTLSVLVFSSKVMRTVSSNVYLLVLAVSDSMYLISVLLTKILTTLRCLYFANQAFDIVNRNTVICKVLQYMQDLFSDYSTCLILAFTVERFIACYHAIKFKEICTVRRARMVCAFLFIGTAVAIAPYHFMYISVHSSINFCSVVENKHGELMFTIFYVVEAMVFRVIPVFVIAIINVFIIVKVTKVNQERKRRTTNRPVSFNNSKRRSSVKEDKNRQLTIMLILVSSSYIICYLPVLVHFVMWKLTRSMIIAKIADHIMIIMQNYARTMYIFGFAINFFLYTMSGRVFRDQLLLLLCGRDKIVGRLCMEKNTEHTQIQQMALTQPLTVPGPGNGHTVTTVNGHGEAVESTLV